MAMAEFDYGIIKGRENASSAAKARDVKLGRPATLGQHVAAIRKLKKQGLGVRAIGRQLKLPPSSVCKALKLKS